MWRRSSTGSVSSEALVRVVCVRVDDVTVRVSVIERVRVFILVYAVVVCAVDIERARILFSEAWSLERTFIYLSIYLMKVIKEEKMEKRE